MNQTFCKFSRAGHDLHRAALPHPYKIHRHAQRLNMHPTTAVAFCFNKTMKEGQQQTKNEQSKRSDSKWLCNVVFWMVVVCSGDALQKRQHKHLPSRFLPFFEFSSFPTRIQQRLSHFVWTNQWGKISNKQRMSRVRDRIANDCAMLCFECWCAGTDTAPLQLFANLGWCFLFFRISFYGNMPTKIVSCVA